jgi:hypothetical protein
MLLKDKVALVTGSTHSILPVDGGRLNAMSSGSSR